MVRQTTNDKLRVRDGTTGVGSLQAGDEGSASRVGNMSRRPSLPWLNANRVNHNMDTRKGRTQIVEWTGVMSSVEKRGWLSAAICSRPSATAAATATATATATRCRCKQPPPNNLSQTPRRALPCYSSRAYSRDHDHVYVYVHDHVCGSLIFIKTTLARRPAPGRVEHGHFKLSAVPL
jgi:hypothetical protein